MTAVVIFCLLLINVFSRGFAYLQRKANANKSARYLLEKSEGGSKKAKTTRIPVAILNLVQNIGNCTSTPTWFGGATVGEVVWNVIYSTALGVFSFHGSE